MKAVLDARGTPALRFYIVRWKGYGAKEDSGCSWRDVLDCQELVDDFWEASGLDPGANISVPSEHRCMWCCRCFKTSAALKGHTTRGCACADRSRTGSLAQKAVRLQKKKLVSEQLTGNAFLGDSKLTQYCCCTHCTQAYDGRQL